MDRIKPKTCIPATLSDVQRGITKVISYLETNIPEATDLVNTLLAVLGFIESHAKQTDHSDKEIDVSIHDNSSTTVQSESGILLQETNGTSQCHDEALLQEIFSASSQCEAGTFLDDIEKVCALAEQPESLEFVQVDDEQFMNLIEDKELTSDICNKNRALNTLPSCLTIRKSTVQNMDMGVFTDIYLQENTCFGPYQGEIIDTPDPNSSSSCFWQITTDEGVEYYVDGQNPAKANWMKYVLCTSAEEPHNLQAFQHSDHIYYKATGEIKPGSELVVCYEYTQEDSTDMKLPSDSDIQENILMDMDDGDDVVSDLYCEKCGLKFTEELYKEHIQLEHKQNEKTSKHGVRRSVRSPRNGNNKSRKGRGPGKAQKGSEEEQACYDVSTRKYTCPFCSKVFEIFSQFHYHYRKHTGEKPHQCEECGRCFRMKGHLKIHELTHTDTKPHSCDNCWRTFSQISNLRRHMRTHTGEKPHECEHCGKKFSDSTTYRCHLRIHTGERPYQCQECNKSFKSPSARRAHTYSHQKVDQQCELCDKTFRGKTQLKQHMKLHCIPLHCPKCKEVFLGKTKLEAHMKRGCGILLRCFKCKELFSGKKKLEEHIKIHLPNKKLPST